MNKKIILPLLLLLSLLIITGCNKKIEKPNDNENETQNQNIPYNEYDIIIQNNALDEGITLTNLVYTADDQELYTTNYKLSLKYDEAPFTYIVKCIYYDTANNICTKSEETLSINKKEIKIDNNEYSVKNYPKIKENFLTYLRILNNSYLLILTDNNGYYENGNLNIYDFTGKKIFEEKNITENYYIEPTNTTPSINEAELFPTVEENKLIYYTCDKNKKKVYKYNLSLENFKKSLIETINNANCHLDNILDLGVLVE